MAPRRVEDVAPYRVRTARASVATPINFNLSHVPLSKTRKNCGKAGLNVGKVIHRLVDNSCGKPYGTGKKFQKTSKNKPKTAFDTLWKGKLSIKVFHRKEFPNEIGEKRMAKQKKQLENIEFPDQKIVDIEMDKEVKKSFIEYSMSVKIGRASCRERVCLSV